MREVEWVELGIVFRRVDATLERWSWSFHSLRNGRQIQLPWVSFEQDSSAASRGPASDHADLEKARGSKSAPANLHEVRLHLPLVLLPPSLSFDFYLGYWQSVLSIHLYISFSTDSLNPHPSHRHSPRPNRPPPPP